MRLSTIGFNSGSLALLFVFPLSLNAQDHYVGSKVCATCHADIFATYTNTAMGRSIVRGSDATLRGKLPVPFTVFDNEAGEYFEVSQKEGDYYQSVYAVGREGKEIFRQSWKLPFVIGSGENGYGFLLQRDGYLFEAPLTYYTKTRVWSFSPGYERANLAFTRPVIAECVSCHGGRPQPVYGKTALYRDPPFAELAVGCENCHGPGELHVAGRRAAIVNPARLPGWLSDNICMKCHQGGDVRVEQPGRHAEDFRPGTRLDDSIAIFKAPLSKESSSQSVLLEHYFSMALSKCYRSSAGKLRCTSCHDPHAQLAGPEANVFYRARCLSCHRVSSCKLPTHDREKTNPSDDCIGCHMPKRTVTTITHAALTDHRVIARPSEPYPDEAFAGSADKTTGLFQLTAEPGQAAKIPAITLFQAYASLVRDGHAEFRARADEMLDRLARESPRNPIVLSALARRSMTIRDFVEAIQAGHASAEDFLLLAGLYGQKKQNAEAIAVLNTGMQANPYVREFPEALAVQHMSAGEYREASDVIRKALELFPDDVTLRVLQKRIQSAALDGAVGP